MVAHAHLDRATHLNEALCVPEDRFETICHKYCVRSIHLFGSAISSRFSHQTSDIDLAVEFNRRLNLPWYGQITGLMEELSKLFGRPVDVIDLEHLRNNELRETIASRGILIFGEDLTQSTRGIDLVDESKEQRNRLQGVLRDIIECCEFLTDFTADKTLDDFIKDKMLQIAVERLLITIGEAANGLHKADPTAEDAISSLKEIVAMRNRLVHQYWTSDPKLLWEAIEKYAPVLYEQATHYLKTHKQ